GLAFGLPIICGALSHRASLAARSVRAQRRKWMPKQVQHDKKPARRGRAMIPPVRPIAIEDIEAARERIKATVLRTPLVKLELGVGAPDIRLKLENLQPTNAYKIRGGANAVAALSDEARAKGVWTISAGN